MAGRGEAEKLMSESDIELLVWKVGRGDAEALGQLLERFGSRVRGSLSGRMWQPDEISELVNDTFLVAAAAIREGRYRHLDSERLAHWLCVIAKHQTLSRRSGERSRKHHHDKLNLEDGLVETLSDGGPTTHQRVERKWLLDFMTEQLDEILIGRASGEQDKSLGHLKKMAFMLFYVDQLTQVEIVEYLEPVAFGLGLAKPVKQSTINNWLARGDILKRLVKHLVDECPLLLSQLSTSSELRLSLSPAEREVLVLAWDEGRPLPECARHLKLAGDELEIIYRQTCRKIADELFARIKQTLHEQRHVAGDR